VDVNEEGTLKKEVRKRSKRRKKCGYVAGEGEFQNKGQEPQGPQKGPKKFLKFFFENVYGEFGWTRS